MASLNEADVVTAPRPSSFSGTSSTSYLDEPQLQQLQPQQRPSQQQQRPHTSRFVEGSMNDRASRAPPVSYLGGIGGSNDRGSRTRSRSRSRGDGGREDPYAHREYQNSTRRSLQMARPSLSAFRSSNSATASAGTSASITSTNTTDTAATSSTTASNSSNLRRPRSFLGPIWDGMTKRLHRRTRSTVEADMAKKRELEQEQQQHQQDHQQQHHMQAMGPTPVTATLPGVVPSGDQLSPEEVMANYQQLMQSGFFSKRAIPATRQGLTSRGGTSSGTDSSAPSSIEAQAACPTRPPPPPPPPPKSAPWIKGTPLSPVAPSPAGTATVTITPRGTKRVRAAADEGEDVDGRHDAAIEKPTGATVRRSTDAASGSPTRNSPRKISKKLRKAPSIRSTPGQDGSVRSLRSMHNAAAAAAAAAEAEYYEAISNQPSFDYSAHDSAASTTRITRSKSGQAPVRVHQPLPPLPVSAAAVSPAAGGDKRIVSKKRKETSRAASLEEERNSYYNHQSAAKPSERRSEAPQETKRKRRSQTAAAVVHQDRQGRSTGDVMILDDDCNRLAPLTHSYRPTGALSPTTTNRGGSLSNSSDNGRTALTTLSPSSSQKKQPQPQQWQPQKQTERPEPPISFHYPQRVRVRRPMQAQVAEVAAEPMLSGNARSKAQINGKSLLFREEDTENQEPIWQD